MVRQLIMVLTCSNCLMTNCPRMPHSISFLRLKLSLTSTLTANRPKTAPDAPREMVALGCNKYDATLAPARAQNVNHGVASCPCKACSTKQPTDAAKNSHVWVWHAGNHKTSSCSSLTNSCDDVCEPDSPYTLFFLDNLAKDIQQKSVT